MANIKMPGRHTYRSVRIGDWENAKNAVKKFDANLTHPEIENYDTNKKAIYPKNVK